MNLTNTVAAQLPVVNPELQRASAARVQVKAGRIVFGVLMGLISFALLVGGVIVSYRFASAAIAEKQQFSASLAIALLVPLVPGVGLGIFSALRFDPDSGSVFTQFATVIGAFRKAIKGNGAPPVQPPPAEG